MRLAAVLFAAPKTFEPLVMNAVPTCAPASSPLAAPSRAQDGLSSDDSRKGENGSKKSWRAFEHCWNTGGGLGYLRN